MAIKRIYSIILVLCFFHSTLFAGENIIDFRFAYEKEKPGCFLVYDINNRELYVEDSSIILLADIAEAEVIVDTEKPPLWLDSAVESVHGKIPFPQIKILVTLNQTGKEKFAQITSDNIGKIIAVFIDNKLVMAPKIMDRIDSGKALITTSFTEKEAQKLVNKINENIDKN